MVDIKVNVEAKKIVELHDLGVSTNAVEVAHDFKKMAPLEAELMAMAAKVDSKLEVAPKVTEFVDEVHEEVQNTVDEFCYDLVNYAVTGLRDSLDLIFNFPSTDDLCREYKNAVIAAFENAGFIIDEVEDYDDYSIIFVNLTKYNKKV